MRSTAGDASRAVVVGRWRQIRVADAGRTRETRRRDPGGSPDPEPRATFRLVGAALAELAAERGQTHDEYPVVPSATMCATMKVLGAFRSADVALNRLGENNRAALDRMDRAGWR